MKQPAIYIMSNKRNGTIYIGVTSDLIKRVYEHKYANVPGFTQRYGCKHLVYKGGSRKKKLALIEKINPYWEDLYESLL